METLHFSLHELADGVFAAVHKEGGAAQSNAGIVDLGERVLVFDAFDSLSAGRELRAAVQRLTGKPVGWLVNSHKHGDHWGGNQAFAEEAVILSTHGTRSGMLDWGAELEALKAKPSTVEEEIRGLEEALKAENDPIQRATLERRLGRNCFLLADLPDFRFCPPVQTFDGTLTFHGSKRRADLVTVGPAHTPEECYLALPAEKVLFTGDLAFFESPPFMAPDCDLPGWLAQLDRFRASEFETFVPGHGRLGGKADLKFEQGYIAVMQELVAGAISDGKNLEEILKLPLPETFAAWQQFASRNENNLRTLYGKLSGGK